MPVRQYLGYLVAAAVLAVLSACTTVRPGEAEIPEGAVMTHRAVFIGESNHDTTGTLAVYQSDEPAVVVLEPGFRMTPIAGARTVVALGRDGYRSTATLGPLLRPEGQQVYALPKHLSITGFNEVWLWNLTSGRPLGLARLTPVIGSGA